MRWQSVESSTRVMVIAVQDGWTFTMGYEDSERSLVVMLPYVSTHLLVSITDGAYEPWYTFQGEKPRLGFAATAGHILMELEHLHQLASWRSPEPKDMPALWDIASTLQSRLKYR